MNAIAPNRLNALTNDIALEPKRMMAPADLTNGSQDGINVGRIDTSKSTLKVPDVLLRQRGWTDQQIQSRGNVRKTEELAAFLNEQGINSVRLGFDKNEASNRGGEFNTLVKQIQTLSDKGISSLVNIWTGSAANEFTASSAGEWQNVVDATYNIPGVIGYELLNEPSYSSGNTYASDLKTVLGGVTFKGNQAVVVNGTGFSTKFPKAVVDVVNSTPNGVFAAHSYPYLHGAGPQTPTSASQFDLRNKGGQDRRNWSTSQWKNHYTSSFKKNFDQLGNNVTLTEFGTPDKVSTNITNDTPELEKITARRAKGHNEAVAEYFGNTSSYAFDLGPAPNDYLNNKGEVNTKNNAAIKNVF